MPQVFHWPIQSGLSSSINFEVVIDIAGMFIPKYYSEMKSSNQR
jgi:hypothetical protein